MPFILEPRQLTRLSWLIFLSVITVPARTAQLEQPSAPPPIEVIKLKWEKEARLPQNFDPSNGGASGSINDSATSARSGGGAGSGGGGNDRCALPGFRTCYLFEDGVLLRDCVAFDGGAFDADGGTPLDEGPPPLERPRQA